jgi:hypothetical protein
MYMLLYVVQCIKGVLASKWVANISSDHNAFHMKTLMALHNTVPFNVNSKPFLVLSWANEIGLYKNYTLNRLMVVLKIKSNPFAPLLLMKWWKFIPINTNG